MTSATSGVGLAVIDSLRNRRKDLRIIGVSTETFGQLRFEFDEVFCSPITDSVEFPPFIESLCQSKGVDLVIAGRDDDLRKLLNICDGFPLIVKPRCGDGSRGVAIVRDEEDLLNSMQLKEHIIQEFVGKIQTEKTEPNLKFGVPLFWNFPELEQGVIVLIVDSHNQTGEFSHVLPHIIKELLTRCG